MGTKQNPAPNDCYARALPDEPMMVLLARDPSAPRLVRMWATLCMEALSNGTRPPADHALVNEAFECASAMADWRAKNVGGELEIPRWRRPQEAEPVASPPTVIPPLPPGEGWLLMASRMKSRSEMEWKYLNASGEWHWCPGPVPAQTFHIPIPQLPKRYTPQELEEALENLHEISRLDALINLGGGVQVSRGTYTASIPKPDAFLRAERRRLAALIPDVLLVPDEPIGKTVDTLIADQPDGA